MRNRNLENSYALVYVKALLALSTSSASSDGENHHRHLVPSLNALNVTMNIGSLAHELSG